MNPEIKEYIDERRSIIRAVSKSKNGLPIIYQEQSRMLDMIEEATLALEFYASFEESDCTVLNAAEWGDGADLLLTDAGEKAAMTLEYIQELARK